MMDARIVLINGVMMDARIVLINGVMMDVRLVRLPLCPFASLYVDTPFLLPSHSLLTPFSLFSLGS